MTIEISPEEDAGVLLTETADQVAAISARRRERGIREEYVAHGFACAGLIADIAAALLDPDVDVVFTPRAERLSKQPDFIVDKLDSLKYIVGFLAATAVAKDTGHEYVNIGGQWSPTDTNSGEFGIEVIK